MGRKDKFGEGLGLQVVTFLGKKTLFFKVTNDFEIWVLGDFWTLYPRVFVKKVQLVGNLQHVC